MTTRFLTALSAAFWLALIPISKAQDLNCSKIFPIPQKMSISTNVFMPSEQTFIAVPKTPSEHDIFLARFLCAELSDRYGFTINTRKISRLPPDSRAILMGSMKNPLIRAACKQRQIDVNSIAAHPEGYILLVDGNSVLIAGADDSGVFYGLQSLRQLIQKNSGRASICGARIEDWPYKPFRGIRLFMPGKDNIPFFKRFLCDFMAMYKFNTLILEVGTCMRMERHPEINAGWLDFARELKYSRRQRPVGPRGEIQDAANQGAGDGGIVEKEDVADVVGYARQLHINVIPEIPSLTHSYYLLTRHRELAEIQNAEWPDTYCPSNPKSYELLFDVLDECIDVIKPKMVHIGHDEWRMPVDVCARCRGIAPAQLYAKDMNKIYNYLTAKNLKVAIWGDHLVEALRGKGFKTQVISKDYSYSLPGALSQEQVRDLIPKDILVFNWFWNEEKSTPTEVKGEQNDILIEQMGFKQVYGNMMPNIQNWARRSSRPSVIGGANSSWAATTEFNFGKDLMLESLGCANLLWSTHWPQQKQLLKMAQKLMPQVRQNLRGITEPSRDNNPVTVVDIGPSLNASAGQEIPDGFDKLQTNIVFGKIFFKLPDPNANKGRCAIAVGTEGEEKGTLAREVNGIRIGKDVSSLIFLHACLKPARSEYAYRYGYNYDDTADLMGWYEIIYEDGLVETAAIRYGVNILEWDASSGRYCYGADAVDCANDGAEKPVVFYSFEWTNPRFGKKISHVNIKGSSGFKGFRDEVIKSNAVVLIAVSEVEQRHNPAQ